MRAEHRYRLMLAMASPTRPPLDAAVTEPGDVDDRDPRPTPDDSGGGDREPPGDWDVGTMTCSTADCDDLPEIDSAELCAVDPSDAELAFSFAPMEIVLDGVAI